MLRGLRRSIAPIRRRVEALLLRGVFSGNPRLVGMCGELHAHRGWLWKFVDTEGVEPTYNAAERALRPAVIWRKLSFGTQSEKGSRFVETLLTVITTCRQQGRDPFTSLTQAKPSTHDSTASQHRQWSPGCERLRIPGLACGNAE